MANKRIINQVLAKKHNDFVESITDQNVKQLVRDNSIITGGSIASLLSNEKVHDYDYYFKNIETVRAVANYYVHKFKELNPNLLHKPVVNEMEQGRVRIRIQSAGVTGEDIKDGAYRYFESQPLEQGENYVAQVTQSVEEGDDLPSELEGKDKSKDKYRPIFLSDNAITLSDKVQLIIRFYGEAEEIHKNYDFAHCINYWESSTKKVVLQQVALESLLAKQLYYLGSRYPVCSIIRMRKFIKAGWHINAGQILKMILQVSELDLKNYQVLEEQLTGVDTAYFSHMLEFIKKEQESKPDFQLDMPYLVSLIDKIF